MRAPAGPTTLDIIYTTSRSFLVHVSHTEKSERVSLADAPPSPTCNLQPQAALPSSCPPPPSLIASDCKFNDRLTVSVSYAGEMEPPPGEGFDPFEREVHGPTVILDDQAGQVRMDSNSSTFENIDVWTCHFR